MVTAIKAAVTIPVMAKARIGHFVEAQILEALDIDYIDESEVRRCCRPCLFHGACDGEGDGGDVTTLMRHQAAVRSEPECSRAASTRCAARNTAVTPDFVACDVDAKCQAHLQLALCCSWLFITTWFSRQSSCTEAVRLQYTPVLQGAKLMQVWMLLHMTAALSVSESTAAPGSPL